MDKFFKLKEHNTTVSTEIMAGLTTFFAMSYILFVNPSILSVAGMPTQAVFLATIIASAVSTLVMGLFANVPYALAPGMGLNAFFTYTVVIGLGFTWQEALGMVFLCGLFNIFITVTKVRKSIIKAIPVSLQHAIGGGIGVFVAYLGFKNSNLITFLTSGSDIITVNGVAPADATAETFSNGDFSVLAGGGVVDLSSISFADNHIGSAFGELGTTFLAAFGGIGSLFADSSRLPLVLMTIFAFSLSDTFDTLGTFIGTGRKTGIFSAEDEKALENGTGFNSKMDRALFTDAIGTSIGAIF